MNYHTNYLLNATISLPPSLSSSLILLSLAPRMHRVQAEGEYDVREDVVGVHIGSALKLKLPSKIICLHIFCRGYPSFGFICVLH